MAEWVRIALTVYAVGAAVTTVLAGATDLPWPIKLVIVAIWPVSLGMMLWSLVTSQRRTR